MGVWFQERRYAHLQQSSERQASYNKSSEWKFINPLLDCGEINSINNDKLSQIRDSVDQLIAARKQEGDIIDTSVYFRDLNNGPWFGINEKEPFAPASLLKVPMMITVFAQAERDPSVLKLMFKYKGESYNNVEYFKASKELVKGHDYSVAGAVEHMIRYSDNNAYFVLYNAISSTLKQTYTYLDIPTPDSDNYIISARTYGSFFRILYNSTFLSREYSEQALNLLSQTEFDQGIVAGVPKSITVAHKFGERQTATGEKYLHDCGIVYEKSLPYMLCVMTKGNDFEAMADAIADVSKTVYEGVRGGRLNSSQ